MIRALRKWLALRELYNESMAHGLKSLSAVEIALGKRHFIAEEAIIQQRVDKSMRVFSWWFFLTKKNKDIKIKELSSCYNSVFSEAKREDLIKPALDNTLIENDIILNPPERPFFCTTDLGDKYISEFWWRFLFDNHYSKAIITAIVIALAGIYINHIFQNTFREINSPPVVNIYPDITLPEIKPNINPIINVYPNK